MGADGRIGITPYQLEGDKLQAGHTLWVFPVDIRVLGDSKHPHFSRILIQPDGIELIVNKDDSKMILDVQDDSDAARQTVGGVQSGEHAMPGSETAPGWDLDK